MPSLVLAKKSGRVTNRKPNHMGSTFIVEWHHIAKGNNSMHRTPGQFLKDLETLYAQGFRPVTVSEWLENRIDLQEGASPVILTFDDSHRNQFNMLPDGTIDPKCGVGIWSAFAKTHPDFPVKGTFYVLPNLWSQPKWVNKKIEMLYALGSEIGNHTMTHVPLRPQSKARVMKEIGDATLLLQKWTGKQPITVAYPQGSTPKDLSIFPKFIWKGRTIETAAALIAGANPARWPSDPKFDRWRIPRIQAVSEPFGIDDWLAKNKAGKISVYVQ